MKKDKILFWISTTIIFLFEGVLTGLTSHSDMSIEGITHLGYPVYFVAMLAFAKVLGAFTLIIPKAPKRLKEWAYAGFAFDFIAALVSFWIIDGFGAGLVLPAVFIAILVVSYRTYHRLNP